MSDELRMRIGRYTTKFRIVAAIEKGDILLLNYLLRKLNHSPVTPVDKLGNNIFAMACYLGNLSMVKYIYNTFHLPINLFNTDGVAPIHLAVKSGCFKVVKWLWKHGADCHVPTQVFGITPYQKCCKMLKNPDYNCLRSELLKIKNFLISKYFEDMRGFEIRKFLWSAQQLKGNKKLDFSKLSQNIIREIAEYI